MRYYDACGSTVMVLLSLRSQYRPSATKWKMSFQCMQGIQTESNDYIIMELLESSNKSGAIPSTRISEAL
jgi:hypothetical protein